MATTPATDEAPAAAPTTGDAPTTTPDADEAPATAPTTGDAPTTTPDADEAPAAAPPRSGTGPRAARATRRSARAVAGLVRAGPGWVRAALHSAWAARPRRRLRLIDVLRILGLARRAVPRAVVGPKAYPQWWQRLLALIALIALVAAIGFVLAAAVGIMVVVAGFLLEQAIS